MLGVVEMQRPTSQQNKNVFINSDELIQALNNVKVRLNQVGHQNSKVDELTKKVQEQQYGFAFCGHFSAGKSTLINKLLGEHVLPASPIPTSTNVVKMVSGSPKVVVEFANATIKSFEGTFENDVVHKYCRDGDNVTKLTIYSDKHELPEDLFILDTPGIDSTDDAHKIAAESTLHIADTVVYMMDYNHVQSEMNYAFLKEMNRRHKHVVLVVNQIDKHQNSEMSFEEYAIHTVKSMENEKISYNAIFFTSAIDPTHPNNEIEQLKSYLENIISMRHQLLSVSVWKEANLIVTDYELWLKRSYENRILQFEQVLSPYHITDYTFLQTELEQIKKETKPHTEVLEEFEEKFLHQFTTLLNNANLMPYHTRNLARDFLEAEQIGYKVRGLFSAKKTKTERNRRRSALFHELKENATTYIDIHFKDLFFKLLKDYQIIDDILIQMVHEFSGQLNEEVIFRSQKKGALFSHEYVLNFSSTLMEEVKSHYRKKANLPLSTAITILGEKLARQNKDRIRQRDDLERKIAACDGIQEINRIIEDEVSILVEVLESIVHDTENGVSRENEARNHFRFKKSQNTKEQKNWINLSKLGGDSIVVESFRFDDEKERRDRAANHIDNVGKVIEKLPNLQHIAENFYEQSKRLREKKFTIALFGAFSAGKSSFANALVGADVLPVSPHPTTATINQILPPTSEHLHGTIHVFYKKETTVLSEINEILQVTGKQVTAFEELEWLLENREKMFEEVEQSENGDEDVEERVDPFELLHPNQLQYLTFVVEGYNEMKQRFGNTEQVAYERYKKLVATERLAAFIDRIDVYYDSPIARQGITLVDTPGANSIHSRHTELAFNYIKHADAIVFLTYYNHAFSKSDREFLIQLGRVKNCFETDKMYFIINAADLAESEEEMNLVTSHVEKNLLQCGIRFPQIYPISSKLALLTKIKDKRTLKQEEQSTFSRMLPGELDGNGLEYSGISAFETSFYSYVLSELTSIAIRGARADIVQLSHTLQKWYDEANKDEATKKQQLQDLRQFVAARKEDITSTSFSIEEQLVRQEIHELIYYVKQRIFYRYFDEFKELINPTNFTSDGDFQQQLRLGIHNVLQFLDYDLIQELRATSFRLEVFTIRCLQDTETHIVKNLIKEDGFSLLRYSINPLQELDFSSLTLLQVSDFEEEMKEHQSFKTFFIEKGNLHLRDKMEERLRLPVDQHLKTYRDYFEEVTLQWFHRELEALKAHHISELELYEQNLSHVLSDQRQTILLHEMIHTINKERNQLDHYVQ